MQTVRAQQVLAVVGAGLGVAGTALVQVVVLALAVAPGLASLGPVAADGTRLPSRP